MEHSSSPKKNQCPMRRISQINLQWPKGAPSLLVRMILDLNLLSSPVPALRQMEEANASSTPEWYDGVTLMLIRFGAPWLVEWLYTDAQERPPAAALVRTPCARIAYSPSPPRRAIRNGRCVVPLSPVTGATITYVRETVLAEPE